MLKDELRDLAAQEERHWWFRARRRIVGSVLEALQRDGAPSAVADLGCGAGVDLRDLPLAAALRVGLDSAQGAIAAARPAAGLRRGAPGEAAGLDPCRAAEVLYVRASAERVPLRGGAFDLALALDVLEHLDDDASALAEAARVLRPGGRIVITAPAWPLLWSEHDVALGHRRRYRRGELSRQVEAAGLRVERATYFNALLFAPSAVYRLAREWMRRWREWIRRGRDPRRDGEHVRQSRTGERPGGWAGGARPGPAGFLPVSDARRLGNRGGRLLEAIFAAERLLLARWDLPFGLSLLIVARKPGEP